MKRILPAILLALTCFTATAEQNYSFSSEFESNRNHYYTANNQITLAPGFQSEPQNGCEVLLCIDSYGVFPPQSGITGGPLPTDNGVVGTIGGDIDVSLSGAAIYNIPIQLPDGLGGMKPQVSICYNNQGRNGLMGWAWDLGCISSITRTGGTLYHDGYISAVDYSHDRFCLDGMRLMNVSNKAYGSHGASYRTEQDQLSKIISYQESGVNGISFFKLWTADGKVLHYGHSSDSKALVNGQGNVNIWLLNKIEDPYGNTVEYHYLNTANSFLLTSITYSGNNGQGIEPAFTVSFQYEDRDDIELLYVGNVMNIKDKLLRKIIVLNGKNEMYHYRFDYEKPNPQSGYPYHLLKQIQFYAGDEHFNPTVIQWGENNFLTQSASTIQVPVITNGIENAFINAVKFNGDFNGDGFTDVISTKPDSNGNYSVADVFLNKGLTERLQFDFVCSFNLKENISWIYVADFDGNGTEDILFSSRNRNFYPFPDRLENDFYLSKFNNSGNLVFVHHSAPVCNIPSDMVETHIIGDFFGDGKHAVLIQSTGESSNFLEASLFITFDEETNSFTNQFFLEKLSSTRCYPADYNGDGITEIMYRNEGKTHIVQLSHKNNSYHYEEIYNGSPSQWEDCFPGDYNGDGMIDAMFYIPGGFQPWQIVLSSKTGFSNISFLLPETFPYSSPGNYQFSLDVPNHTSHYIKVADLDGNGCADLAMYEDQRFYVFYGPIRAVGDQASFAYSQVMSESTFHNYDNMSASVGNFLGQENMTYLGNNTLSRLAPITRRQEVRAITDGLGRITKLNYGILMPNPNETSENDFYRMIYDNSNNNQKLFCIPVPLRALKTVTTYNVKDKPVETRCFYGGAMFQYQGKGFLGFSYTRQDNYCDNKLEQRTVRKYEITPMGDALHMGLTEEKVYDRNERLLAKSDYDNLLYTHINNDKVFIPTFNKTMEEYDVDSPGQLIQKKILEISVENNYPDLYHYNDCLSISNSIEGTTTRPNVSLASSCEFQEITSITYLPNQASSWIINRPATTTTRLHKEGAYNDICHHKTFTYDTGKPYQINSTTEIPNDGSETNDRLALKTTYLHDPVGNIISKTLSAPNDNIAPRTEQFEYSNDYGRRLLTKQTNAMKQETFFRYDSLYNYCTSITDCNGLVTRFNQDPIGISCTTYYPDNTVACKAIRWAGASSYLIWEKKTGQATKISHYAVTGEQLKELSYDIDGETIITNYVYDANGRLSKKTLPHKPDKSAGTVLYDYDNYNRINKISHADGSYETISYDGNLRSTCYHATEGGTQTESKTVNAMGWTVKSTDNEGNSIVYDYYPDGKPHWTMLEGMDETKIEMTYDGWGNRVSLNDPNYGLTTCEYNAFGELISRQSPKLDRTDFYYDALGNTIKRIETSKQGQGKEVTEWFYGDKQGEFGLLKSITTSKQCINYEYDKQLRLKLIVDKYQGKEYPTRYTYDKASRVASIIYPSNYKVYYVYTSEGILNNITNSESESLWRLKGTTPWGQPERFVTGNGFETCYGYDPNTGRLLSIRTNRNGQNIHDYEYEYDDFSNMTRRTDVSHAHSEFFGYDALNRLTSVTDEKGQSTFSYDALGRMTQKCGPEGIVFSNADYDGPKPHAIKSAQSQSDLFPTNRMDIQYTLFDKVASIPEGSKQVAFDYGYDHQRIMMSETTADGTSRTKIYINQCEFIEQEKGSPVVRTILSGPSGVFAVAENKDGKTEVHYIHKDHLGSWTTISDSRGNIEQECHYDAWGNCTDQDKLMFDRGFTGHEHIQSVNLINMNGRLYDPVTSSMLSPDNNIQTPDFSQNLNRYSYCLNNPLTYTDPDGNAFIEYAMLYLFLSCTEMGYEMQKYVFFVAFHIDLHLSSQQLGIGLDVSLGIPKKYDISYRTHLGATYYWNFFDDSYQGWEFRVGGEWYVGGCIGYSGTTFYQKGKQQTTNSVIVGNFLCNAIYENDYMGNIGKFLIGIPPADGGDRYRSAAVRVRLGPLYAGVNFFTGDPGLSTDDRRTFADTDAGGRETYTINDNGDNPDEYRAGIAYVGLGPFRIGCNSEKIRNVLQNRFAHDLLCRGNSPYFKMLDRPAQTYFYFGTQSGSTLW